MWSDKQKDVFENSTHSFNIGAGAVSAGKTYIFNVRWYEYMYSVPNGSLLALTGKTLGALYDNVIRELERFDSVGDLKLAKAKEGIVTRIKIMSTGTEIACAGADNQSSWQSVQGKTIAGFLADEVTHQPKNLIMSLSKGCRQGGKQWSKFFSCNPENPMHYVKTDYIDNPDIDVKHWHFTMDDNPSLTDAYKAELKATYKGIYYDRFILGRWVIAEGSIYDNWDKSKHTATQEQINEYIASGWIKNFMIALDWGYEHSLAMVLIGTDKDGCHYIVDTYKKTKQVINEAWLENEFRPFTRNRVKEVVCDSARPDLIELCDSHRFAGQFPAVSFQPCSKYKDSVRMGIDKVQNCLTKGRLKVNESLIDWQNEIESYHWKANKDELHTRWCYPPFSSPEIISINAG